MRLTLRTLLAYLDHVLESGDARELESKIRESKLARHTMERIDKGLVGQNAAAAASEQDPNVLAEYLDNTLPPEQVPQFERLCFENDANLIEAASVHRILSVVVTRPVHISKALTNRLKELGTTGAAGAKAASSSTPNATDNASSAVQKTTASPQAGTTSVAESNGHAPVVRGVDAQSKSVSDSQTRTVASMGPHGLDMSDRSTNSVPEYLRGRSDTVYLQAAIAALLLVALGLVAWVSVGPFDQLTSLFQDKPVVSEEAIDEAEKVAANTIEPATKKAPIVAEDSAPPLVTKVTPPVEERAIIIEETIVAPPTTNVETKKNVPDPSQPKTAVPEKEPSSHKIIVEDKSAPPVISTADPFAEVADSPIVIDVAASNVAPPIPSPSPSVAEPSAKSSIIWQPENKDSTSAIVMAMTIDDLGKKSVRLVNIAETLPLATRLVVPDAYRTELRVAPGLKWVVSSATDMQGDGGDDPSIAYVRMRLGRALLHATADCSKVIVKVGDEEFKIVMDSPTAIASIEVRYFPRPGVKITPDQIQPESPAHPHVIPGFLMPVVSVGSIAGKAQVQSKIGVSWSDPLACEPGAVIGFVDGLQKGPHVFAELPGWYRTSIERPIDAQAANDLALELQTAPAPAPAPAAEGAPAVAEDANKESLLEILTQSTHARRSETAALSARTLALLGYYDSIFGKDAVMSLASSRPHRTLIMDSLIQSLGIGPTNATNLIAVMDKYDPPRGSRLLSILSLPDAKELTKPEGALPYIEALSSSYLDERAVAIYQLSKITGKEFAYQADRVTTESLANWRKVYISGRIEWNPGSIKPLEWDTNQ